ncbi:RidA family protein [Pseudonocardia sp. TRM90224]|uniref:RidA family protein n=1 Tax=Pseudonocardia sp. TRM90224 TaxID=2812678 RepID=UPI001E63865C|nr:RidA family protein [Pseudonocardia sp. TRM90224]
MDIYVHNPTDGVYATDGDWVHAVEVRGAERTVYVSGTMGLDPAGAPGATLEEQLDLVWQNIRVILGSAGMTLDNIVRVTSYLRDGSYADTNAKARVAALNGRAVATTAIVVQTLLSEWLIEIEVIAAA